jgi:hypothetical protein
MPFQKGKSGNPGGKPKAIVEVVTLAQANTKDAMQTLVEICRNRSAPEAARVMASVAILDRGWGRPTQRQEIAVSADLAAAVERLRGLRGDVGAVIHRTITTIDALETDG